MSREHWQQIPFCTSADGTRLHSAAGLRDMARVRLLELHTGQQDQLIEEVVVDD
jgi:hypothetical protein